MYTGGQSFSESQFAVNKHVFARSAGCRNMSACVFRSTENLNIVRADYVMLDILDNCY